MDINPWLHDPCNLEMIRMCKRSVKVGSGHVFVVLGAHVRVFIPINVCHFTTNFAWTSKMFMLVKVKHWCYVKMAFVLTSIVQLNVLTLSDFKAILCICMVKNMGQFTYSKSKVASLLCSTYFGMRIGGGAQLLSRSQLVDHTSIPLIFFQVNLIDQRSYFEGDKTRHLSFASLSSTTLL
jgi:hypothetical protein